MATSVYFHAFTIQQRTRLDQDLSSIEEELQSVTRLIRACCGGDSQVAIRADEVGCALQRLKWELERVHQKQGTAAV